MSAFKAELCMDTNGIFWRTYYIVPTPLHYASRYFSNVQLYFAGAISNSAQDVRSEVDLFLKSWSSSFCAEDF